MSIRAAWQALWGGSEVKQSAAGPVYAQLRVGQAVLTPHRFDRLADEGYTRNVIAYRAVNEIARGAASVQWKLFKVGRASRAEVEEHDLLDLIERPNPMMGRSEFMEGLFGFLMFARNSYMESVGTGRRNDPPRELWTPRPDRMFVIPANTGMPKAYEYRAGGATKRWEADPVTGQSDIRHVKLFNPLDDWYGLSPMAAAALSIDQHNEQGKWNAALLQNAAVPSGVLVYEPKEGSGALTDEQFHRLKAEWQESYQGAKNAGRPPLLEGGMTWKQTGLSQKDMDFLNAKNTSARDIALAFGVPPQLLGIPGDNTYSNYQEARLALWEETILPLLSHLAGELNAWLAPRFGENLMLEPGVDSIPALSARREAKRDSVRKDMQAGLLTINEGREELGRDKIEGGDTIYIPATQVPLGFEADSADDPPIGGTDPDEAEKLYRLTYGDHKGKKPRSQAA